MTKDTQTILSFASISGKKVEADFNGGTTTSDGGVLLLRELESRKLLEAELKAAYFVPTILNILSVEPKGAGSVWEVFTDDGQQTFSIMGRDNLDGLEPPSVRITDKNSHSYRIEDYWALDQESREMIKNLLPDKILRARFGRTRMKGGSSGGGMRMGFG